ncbi:MAG: HAD-IA family hydrolase [Anaerolineaceae bacterium]|nr:HAD-IA family hydrolase [Anaerolineaceae bacterium]
MALAQSEIKAVLLDLDRTLADSRAWCMKALDHTLVDGLGLHLEEQELDGISMTPTRDFLARYCHPGELDAIADLMRRNLLAYHPLLEIYPGVLAALEALRAAGLNLAVVTSQTCEESRLTRQGLNIDAYIEQWITASDVKRVKPDPEPVWVACQRLGVDPAETVMVGDAMTDLQAGRAAGALTGAALWGSRTRQEMLDYRPDFIFEQAADMKAALVTRQEVID